MKQRSLIVLSLIAAIFSSVLLAYVILQIEKSHRDVAWTYSGSGLSLLSYNTQNSLITLRFAEAIYTYRANKNSQNHDELQSRYLREFDILWSALVSLKQLDNTTQYPELIRLRDGSREILDAIDPLMRPDVVLTEEQLDQIIKSVGSLAKLNTNLGTSHLSRISTRSAELNQSIAHLQLLGLLLALTLLVSLASTCYLIWRLRQHDRQQTEQLRVAHQQQEELVNELRSGEADKRAKNQFLAAVSHDLRQPLHALGLFLNSLEKNVEGDDGKRILDKIRSSTTALNGLFNALLDLSQLDAGVVEVEKTQIPLNSLFNLLREEYRQTALDQNITLEIGKTDLYVHSDQMLLTRILRNLLENALAHAPNSNVRLDVKTIEAAANSTIEKKKSVLALNRSTTDSHDSTLEKTSHQTVNDVEIFVSDTGPGIPEHQRKVVFSEYYQLNNPERDRNKGLGLGLSIVKRLSNLMGHDLALSENKPRGTVFSICLPACEAPVTLDVDYQTNRDTLQSDLLHGLKVIVIDDEKDILDGMVITLGTAGCDVHTCESGDEARDLVVKEDLVPDLIIADYRLRKNETGSQAVEQIREELNEDVPAFLITGDTSAARVKEASDSGIRLLHKPVLPTELLQVMTEVAGARENLLPGIHSHA